VLINGTPLPTVFGTEGAQWHWQDGGQITLSTTKVTLALHDLTGFEGRCDAIVLSPDLKSVPPNADPEMERWRRLRLALPEQPEQVGPFDLVVVGGGISGTCAALAAARLGLSVAFIQDRPVLGGNNSSEVRVWLNGARNVEPFPRVGDIVAELEQQRRAHYGPDNTADLYEDDRKLALVQAEANIKLFLEHRANGVEMQGDHLAAVVAQSTVSGRRLRFAARWFADCTGDGSIGFLAGADHEVTLRGHMGPCNLWNVLETDRPQTFPRCPWALDLSDKPFPGRGTPPNTNQLGGWYWESGFDHDPIAMSEYIRDWNFLAMYGAWDALKNVDHVLPNHKLNWAAFVAGKRESLRLLGDVILSEHDVVHATPYPDGCVPTGWLIDLHLPDERYVRGFEGDAFISKAHYTKCPLPYWVPYRCLYSRNIANLFMAGRNISVAHEALGTVRVMRTGGCMGEIVGMAAAICRKRDCDPRAVYQRHLEELQELMRVGVGKPIPAMPPQLSGVGPNIAPLATVTTSGDRDPQSNPVRFLNDGQCATQRNDLRWLSAAAVPHWIELRWPQPHTIVGARVVSGYFAAGKPGDPVDTFTWQVPDENAWRDVPDARSEGNQLVDWQRKFAPLSTDRLRLVVTQTKGDISRIWEIEIYEQPQ
jgi:hypothetical protein